MPTFVGIFNNKKDSTELTNIIGCPTYVSILTRRCLLEAGMTLKTEERSLLKLMQDRDLHSCKITELCPPKVSAI